MPKIAKTAYSKSNKPKYGGRYRTRTCDFLHVKETLSQLS